MVVARLSRSEKTYSGMGAVFGVGAFVSVGLCAEPELGVLFGLIAAVCILLATIHHWINVRDKIFTHGFHAGYHTANVDQLCDGPECDVLDFAVERGQRR